MAARAAELRTADRDHPTVSDEADPQQVIDPKADLQEAGLHGAVLQKADPHRVAAAALRNGVAQKADLHLVVQAAALNSPTSKHRLLLMVKSTLTQACVSKAIRPIACRRTVSNAL